MKVTEVRISPAKGGKIRAFASIVVDDCFIVNDLRVIEGRENQFFVTMPARKARNGQMRDIAHPLNRETREAIEERVLEEYQNAVRHLAVPDPRTARSKTRHRRIERRWIDWRRSSSARTTGPRTSTGGISTPSDRAVAAPGVVPGCRRVETRSAIIRDAWGVGKW